MSSKPTRMARAKEWTPEVENAFRFQCAGWRDEREYVETLGDEAPEFWDADNGGFVKKLRSRDSKTWYYFHREPECASKDLNKTKLYYYE